MNEKTMILLTNDDGFHAEGLQALYRVLCKIYRVTIVAPDAEQSGISHAFTYKKPLRFKTHEMDGNNSPCYSVAGTPADCVKFALGHLLSEKPRMVISGINNGSNAGVAGFYSGTVGAAREGSLWRVPSIAFSISEKGFCHLPEYADAAARILTILPQQTPVANHPVFYNINFPSCHPSVCKGIKITRQSLSFYDDHYTPKQLTDGSFEYWLRGPQKDVEQSDEFDVHALEKNFITVTPLHCDATANDAVSQLLPIEKLFT